MGGPEADDHDRLVEWAEVIDESNYYEILGLLEIADPAAVKQAFHEFALAFHPDAHVGAAPEVLDALRRVFRRGAEAYRVLVDASTRAKYDMALAQGHLRLEAGEIPQGLVPAEGVQSLVDVCRSPAAKLSAQRADHFLSTGDLAAAKRELKLALYHDGNENPELEERIDAVDLAMFAMGD